MTTMTMPTVVERSQTTQPHKVSQMMPLLLAILLLAAIGVVSVLISGPMH